MQFMTKPMKMRKLFLSFALAVCAVAALAQGSSDAVFRDKMTSAVMKVYDDHLAQNPNDYNILFARAHQYYYNGDYTAALADVNQALMLTPKGDKELRFDEYILRARISDARRDFTSELADLHLAQELEPKSLACTDLIAKANLKSGDLNAAENAFKTILRAEPMNYDAMYGMAQVEQARGNAAAAIEHVTKATELFRVEPQVYVNRADIYTRQGNIDAAVLDLLNGMAVGNGGNAAQRLFDLSDTHYDDVMRSLADIAGQSVDGGGIYRYLRANIAMDHCRYSDALADLNNVMRTRSYDSPTVYFNAGRCCFELEQYADAARLADQALAMDSSQPEYYLLKSQALYYASDGGNVDAAMEWLDRCSLVDAQYVPMLMAKAALYSRQGQDETALSYLNAALDQEPDNAEALLSRATLLQRLGQIQQADQDMNTMLMLSDDVYDLKGFALYALGHNSEAMRWLQQITSNSIPGGEAFYYAAMLMANRGDNFKAMEYITRAIELGYGSRHRLEREELLPATLAPLRSDQGFKMLLEKASPNFNHQ